MANILQLHPPVTAVPVPPDRDRTPGLQTSSVYVLFTTIEETLTAVRMASSFAAALEVPLTVLHFRAVAYSVPIDSPAGISPIETTDFIERLRGAGAGLEPRIRVHLCRDATAAIPLALPNPSLVVIGGRRRWWVRSSTRWRRALEATGHLVIFAGSSHA